MRPACYAAANLSIFAEATSVRAHDAQRHRVVPISGSPVQRINRDFNTIRRNRSARTSHRNQLPHVVGSPLLEGNHSKLVLVKCNRQPGLLLQSYQFGPHRFVRTRRTCRNHRSDCCDHQYQSDPCRCHMCPPTDFRVIQLAPCFLPRQIVTTMLPSAVAVTENSSRARQSAQRKGLVRHALPAAALPLRHPLSARHPSLTRGFLIANPELEFPASCCKQRSELFSNRKFSALLRSPQPTLDPVQPRDLSTVLIAPFLSPSLQPQAPNLQNLIVTLRLEFRVTPTKQNSNPISNRYKTAFFAPLFHSSPITRHSSLTCSEAAGAAEGPLLPQPPGKL